MKQSALKSLIKQAVKEAIQEELKEILLEAIKQPKQPVIENTQSQKITEGNTIDSKAKREAYQNILGDMQAQFTTQNIPKPFSPQGGAPGLDLPEGEVNMNQIMGLMNSK